MQRDLSSNSLLGLLDELEGDSFLGPSLLDEPDNFALAHGTSPAQAQRVEGAHPQQPGEGRAAELPEDQKNALALLLHLGSGLAPALGVPWPHRARPTFRLPPLVPQAVLGQVGGALPQAVGAEPGAAATTAAAAAVAAAAPPSVRRHEEPTDAPLCVQAGVQLPQAFRGGGGSSLPPAAHPLSSGSGGSRSRGRKSQGASEGPEHARLREQANSYVRKCRAKQRATEEEAKAGVGALLAELEQLRVSKKEAEESAVMQEQILRYQELMLAALVAARQADAEAEQEEGEPSTSTEVQGIVPDIVPEMQAILHNHDKFELNPIELLLRYPVAGYTKHMGPDGRAREAPPLAKVFEDYAQAVRGMKLLLEQGHSQGQQALAEHGEAALFAAERTHVPGEGLPIEAIAELGRWQREQQEAELEQQRVARQQRYVWQMKEVRDGRSSTEGPVACSGASSSSLLVPEPQQADSSPGVSGGAEPAAAAALSTAGAAAGGMLSGVAPGGMLALPEGLSSARPRIEQAIAAVNATLDASLGSKGGTSSVHLGHSSEAYLRHFLVVSSLRGSQPWSLVDGGVMFWDQEGPCLFTGPQLLSLTRLLQRADVNFWQQGMLFLPNAIKLFSLRLDNEQPPRPEDMGIERWEGILDQLHLQPSQMKELVKYYERCLLALQPFGRQRQAAVERLAQLQQRAATAGVGEAHWQAARDSLEWAEATKELNQAALAEFAVYGDLFASTCRVLHFPLQKVKHLVLSWPLAPQADLLAMAATRRTGLHVAGEAGRMGEHSWRKT